MFIWKEEEEQTQAPAWNETHDLRLSFTEPSLCFLS